MERKKSGGLKKEKKEHGKSLDLRDKKGRSRESNSLDRPFSSV